MPMLHVVGESGELRRRERVEDREQEDAGRNRIERLHLRAHRQIREQPLTGYRRIAVEGARDLTESGDVEAHQHHVTSSQWPVASSQ
jgi:hypothetical protein